jgi:hypothetical protein
MKSQSAQACPAEARLPPMFLQRRWRIRRLGPFNVQFRELKARFVRHANAIILKLEGGIAGFSGVGKGGSAPRYFWQILYISGGGAAKFDPAFVKQSSSGITCAAAVSETLHITLLRPARLAA